jgi:hypothetical protein
MDPGMRTGDPRRRAVYATSAISVALLAICDASLQSSSDPFAFFRPSVVVSENDRRRLDREQPLAKTVPSPGSGSEVAVFAAMPVSVDGDRLVAWVRQIVQLKKSPYVLAIGRFSDPPRLEDLSGLALDSRELSEIMECRPGDCGLKLAGSEMRQLQSTPAGSRSDGGAALQQAFRSLVLERVQKYMAGGHAALPAYEHRSKSLPLAATFSSVLDHTTFLTEHAPRFADHLRSFPRDPMPDVESFAYWSKERFSGKPIIRATHVSILRGAGEAPDALVVGKDIFSTHYVNASVGVTALVRGDPVTGNYLVYFNRSNIDLLGGVFGGLVRRIIQNRLHDEAEELLIGLKQRLESGEPH